MVVRGLVGLGGGSRAAFHGWYCVVSITVREKLLEHGVGGVLPVFTSWYPGWMGRYAMARVVYGKCIESRLSKMCEQRTLYPTLQCAQ